MWNNPNKFWNYDGSNNGKFLMECDRLNEKIQQQKRKALSPEGSKIEICFLENSNTIDIRCDNKEVFPIDNDGYNFFYDLDDFVISNNYQDVMEKKKNELLTAIHNSRTSIKKDLEEMKKYIKSIKTTKLSQNQKKQLTKRILEYKNHEKYLKKLDDAIFYAKNKILNNYNNAIIKHNKMYKEKNITLKNSVKKSVFKKSNNNDNFQGNQVKQSNQGSHVVFNFQYGYNNGYNNVLKQNYIQNNKFNNKDKLNQLNINQINNNNQAKPLGSKLPTLIKQNPYDKGEHLENPFVNQHFKQVNHKNPVNNYELPQIKKGLF